MELKRCAAPAPFIMPIFASQQCTAVLKSARPQKIVVPALSPCGFASSAADTWPSHDSTTTLKHSGKNRLQWENRILKVGTVLVLSLLMLVLRGHVAIRESASSHIFLCCDDSRPVRTSANDTPPGTAPNGSGARNESDWTESHVP